MNPLLTAHNLRFRLGSLVLISIILLFSMFFICGCDLLNDLTGKSETNGEETPERYTLSLICDGPAFLEPEDSVEIEKNAVQEIIVSPADGFSFLEWEVFIGNGVSIAAPSSASTTVTLSEGPAVLRARLVYNSDLSTITIITSEGGQVDQEGENSVELGEPTSIKAIPSIGYHFDGWTIVEGDGASIASIIQANTTVTITSGTATIQANFKDAETQAAGSLLVQAAEGGTVTPQGSQTVRLDQALEISADSNSGYDFTGWSVLDEADVTLTDSTAATTTVTLNSGVATVEAGFSPIPEYTLTVAESENGTGRPTDPTTEFRGTPISITASPDPGYIFDHWQIVYWLIFGGEWVVDDSPTGITIANPDASSTTVTLTGGDRAVQAVFIEAPSHIASISNVKWAAVTDSDRDNYAEALLLQFDVTVTGSGTFSGQIYYTPERGMPTLYGIINDIGTPVRPGEPIEVQYAISAAGMVHGTYDFSIRVMYQSDIMDTYSGSPLIDVGLEP